MSTVDTTLNLEGELRERDLFELGEKLVRLMYRGSRRVVVDFSEVSHLDFRGLRPLEKQLEWIRKEGGDVKFCGLSSYLRAILRAAGTHAAFECYEHEAAARAAFVRASVVQTH